jgi:hypothetical protein
VKVLNIQINKYVPKFGRLIPGSKSVSVGTYRLYKGNIINVNVRLTMGSNPEIAEYPYVRLPFPENDTTVPWTAYFMALNQATNKPFYIKGNIRNSVAIVDIAQHKPFTWSEGDALFMTAIYQYKE